MFQFSPFQGYLVLEYQSIHGLNLQFKPMVEIPGIRLYLTLRHSVQREEVLQSEAFSFALITLLVFTNFINCKFFFKKK